MESLQGSWVCAAVLLSICCMASAVSVSHDSRSLLIDGERKIIISGSIHYPRSTPGMWPDLIRKAKEGGLDAIETYVFWNSHEPSRREYNFEGNLDIVRFIREIHNAGLYAVIRIGPYVCAEWNYGGLPAWLWQIEGMQFRTDNQPFKDEMQNFTTLIVNKLKEENLLATQGGPIILTQIENEYGNVEDKYGDAGKKYIQWCANMAESLGVDVPWIMCQQKDAPHPMIETCNGYYCDDYEPTNATSPKMWTENWTGWFKAWDEPDHHRSTEDVAFSVARFFQRNGTFQNYYMYHGGTNFGRTSGGPYIATSYDYDAPLDEYGNLRQPKWGHLKDLHVALKAMEKALVYGKSDHTEVGHGVAITKYSVDGSVPGCFLSNTNTTIDANVVLDGTTYFVPAWSVSVLPDCKHEAINTAKVNAQTSLMEKKPNKAEKEPEKLSWSWRPEKLGAPLLGLGATHSTNKLLDQIHVTADTSDYLWYMTSVNLDDKVHMTLRVNTTGHVLHAFVNGALVGSQYAADGNFSFVFSQEVSLKAGKNQISLLSATIGLKNYGAFYEKLPYGIVGGPVELVGGNVTISLTSNEWSYKIGLDGEEKQVHLSNPKHNWLSGLIPGNRPFTWYQTTFQAPLGTEPVALDLIGMGKGAAWVNGYNIGRYWPSSPAHSNGCDACDYRGTYKDGKCLAGCGEPAQRWYHVPRSFLIEGEPNTLVLFEESGGYPDQVNFQTVTAGTICSSAHEGKTLNLACQGGRTISKIEFASFGNPNGTCGSFQAGDCEAPDIYSTVQQACVGQESCSIEVSGNALRGSKCEGVATRTLAVQATC